MRADAWQGYVSALVALPTVRVLATMADEPRAVIVLGHDTRHAYELLAGATDDGLKIGASVHAAQKALERLRAEGIVETFDFAGANIGSIAHFKRGFGGRLVPYYAVSWARNRWAHWLAVSAPGWRRRLSGGR